MNCKICEAKAMFAFSARVLKKYDVSYYKCNNCGFLFTQEPFWLNESYERAINISDTGLVERNISFSKILSVIIYFNFNKNAKFLDYAGGYGLFTRLTRDIGFDFYWNDPYTQNILANGFEHHIDLKYQYELITAFEVFEHLVHPKEEILKMLQLSDTIVFSTELLSGEIPDIMEWWYYGFEHGQHVSFYSSKTFKWLANHLGLNYYNINGIHLLTKRRLNNSILQIEKKLCNYGLFTAIKKIVKSKTYADHLELKNFKQN